MRVFALRYHKGYLCYKFRNLSSIPALDIAVSDALQFEFESISGGNNRKLPQITGSATGSAILTSV